MTHMTKMFLYCKDHDAITNQVLDNPFLNIYVPYKRSLGTNCQQDVTVLETCLDSASLGEAVAEFGKKRMPDVEALIKIVRVAAPFQPLGRSKTEGQTKSANVRQRSSC